MVLEIYLTKNYSTECMERKKSEHIQARTNRRRLVLYPAIQLVIVNLYTKYELSVLYSCGDIFDEKIWRERKKNKYREEQVGDSSFSIPRYNLPLSTCIPNMKFLFWRNITVLNACRERKVNIYREEHTGEGWFSIPRYNLPLSLCTQTRNFLCYTVVEISLTKNMERKKKEQI